MGQQMENRPEEDMQRWAAADCVAGRFGDYVHRRCRSAVDCDDHWIAAGSSRLPKVLRCWQRQEKRKPPSGTPYRCWWRPLMGTGFLIFRQVQDNYRFGRRATHRASFRSQRPEPCTSGYQPCHNPVDLAEKANPCCESKNTTKNKIKCNSSEVTIADV